LSPFFVALFFGTLVCDLTVTDPLPTSVSEPLSDPLPPRAAARPRKPARSSARSPTSPQGHPALAPRQRLLGLDHFAFMRALVQGLDLATSWERYLSVEGESSDLRLVRSTLNWIRQELAAAARREDRLGLARLVRIDLRQLAQPSPELPSLEDFAESRGLEDAAQAEQIAAYEEAFGRITQRLQRRARLIARQLDALRWLEDQVAQPPRAGDALSAWLHPSLARLLEAADLFTVAQLVERINGIGRRWYGPIRSLGPGKAQRLVAWLRRHEATLGLSLGPHIDQARSRLFAHELAAVVAPATAIVPLEKLLVPAELDGRAGLYRRPQAQCLLAAHNDYEALLAWLRAKQGLTPEQKAQLQARRRHRDSGVASMEGLGQGLGQALGQDLAWLSSLSHTQRAYRKEGERFLLWALVQRGKALSSMNHEDCQAYRDFLADPQPRSRWCGARSRERWSPLWRPFEGPLSASAQRQALTILKNLYGFLVDQNYLMGNPWSAIGVPRNGGPKLNAGRSLSLAQWQLVREQLQVRLARADSSANRRLALAVPLLYATGLRLSEVCAATLDDLRWVEYPGDADDEPPLQGWMLRVLGKGQRLREVPVPDALMTQLSTYLVSRGLHAQVENFGNQGAHLLGLASDLEVRAPSLHGGPRAGEGARLDPRQGVAPSTLYDQIKAFFVECAEVLRTRGEERGAERLARASTHWLRHSHASHAIAAGMPIEVAQQNLGHASLATTTIYVRTEDKRRMRAVRAFWSGKG
jgi:site-specific recombinase XerD